VHNTPLHSCLAPQNDIHKIHHRPILVHTLGLGFAINEMSPLIPVSIARKHKTLTEYVSLCFRPHITSPTLFEMDEREPLYTMLYKPGLSIQLKETLDYEEEYAFVMSSIKEVQDQRVITVVKHVQSITSKPSIPAKKK
jgi:hypothetical protein